ncbi:hypothetical protein C8R46DRAFT_672788 [Mycena filopes]|nr:hypothetical protein C8R46DRAFT_672788 [Mycena filopes]
MSTTTMKLQPGIFVLAALLHVRGAALVSQTSSLSLSVPASESGTDSSAPTIPTPTDVANTTGGFVVTGVYTTCLTLTFDGGATDSSLPTVTPVVSASAPDASPTNFTPAEPQPSDPLAGPSNSVTSTPDGQPTPSTPSDTSEQAIFTTCLVFLPSETATPGDGSEDGGNGTDDGDGTDGNDDGGGGDGDGTDGPGDAGDSDGDGDVDPEDSGEGTDDGDDPATDSNEDPNPRANGSKRNTSWSNNGYAADSREGPNL